MRKFSGFLLAVGLVATAEAHHSVAMFDASKTVTLEGTVSKWMFTNPHSWLYVVVKNEQGADVTWELEGGSPSHLARNGWTFRTLKQGDQIKVTISPRVDGRAGGTFKTVTLPDGTAKTSMGSAPSGARGPAPGSTQ